MLLIWVIAYNSSYVQFSQELFTSYRVATNLENVENSGNLKNCENLRENSGKFELLWKKPGKLRESEKYVTWSPTKMHSSSFSLLSCSGEKFKISWRTQGKLREFSFSKMWSSCHNFNLKLIIKAVQIVDSSKITHMIRCAWNASSMYPPFKIVPQLHSDTVL